MVNKISTMTLFERALLHFDHLRLFDPFRPLPTRINKIAGKCRAVCEGVAHKIMDNLSADEVEESDNLITHLVRANKRLSQDSKKEDHQSVLIDDEIVGQITTALLAGHETTSTSLSWALMAIARDQRLQKRLREEITCSQIDLESLSPEDFDGFAKLENFTKEVLRLYSPVQSTNREALEDDIIPLSKPIRNKANEHVDHLIIRKGQAVIIQVAAYNQSEEIWGPTALNFDPDRWDNLPKSATESNFPNGHLSFLAGARTCVGFRLAILEVSITP